MKFVTSAYKKKLMEQKKWELQQKLEEEREQRNDVTKTGMSGYVPCSQLSKSAMVCWSEYLRDKGDHRNLNITHRGLGTEKFASDAKGTYYECSEAGGRQSHTDY